MPRLTIGMPVCNGASLLSEALENLERQTFQDFQVVISDNASTDETERICRRFAENRPGVVYVRQDERIDILSNFKFVLEHCDTPLFAYRAYDDLSSDNYFEVLVALFDEDNACRLAAGRVEIQSVTQSGAIPFKTFDLPDLPGCSRVDTFCRLLSDPPASWFYGVWKTGYLRRILTETAAEHSGYGADHYILFATMLEDALRLSPDALFITRIEAREDRTAEKQSFTSASMMLSRESFRSAALARLKSALHDKDNYRTAASALEPYLDRILFSRRKIRRTRMKELVGLRGFSRRP